MWPLQSLSSHRLSTEKTTYNIPARAVRHLSIHHPPHARKKRHPRAHDQSRPTSQPVLDWAASRQASSDQDTLLCPLTISFSPLHTERLSSKVQLSHVLSHAPFSQTRAKTPNHQNQPPPPGQSRKLITGQSHTHSHPLSSTLAISCPSPGSLPQSVPSSKSHTLIFAHNSPSLYIELPAPKKNISQSLQQKAAHQSSLRLSPKSASCDRPSAGIYYDTSPILCSLASTLFESC